MRQNAKPRDTLALFRAACGFWLGVSLFFTFGVARTLFATYPRETAGEITSALFPSYYLFLYVAGAAACIGMALGHEVCPRWKPSLILVLFAVLFIGTIDFKIAPVMHAIELPEGRAQFARLHGLSMGLNLLAMLAVAAALAIGRRCPLSPVTRSAEHSSTAGLRLPRA